MRQLIITAVIALGLMSGIAAPAVAAPCKDAHGKFVKCPPPRPVAPPAGARCKDAKGRFIKCPPPPTIAKRCKDGKGRFVKCGMPGARPA